MEINYERYHIIGILCYLNYPKYLKLVNINCITDIFDKMEEEIEDNTTQLRELEKYYQLLENKNDKTSFFHKISRKREELIKMQNQLKFIKK